MANTDPNYRIKVIGVGGGGCNAVNRMIEFGVASAEFIAINTDAQALEESRAQTRLQIGNRITNGKGAGAHPEVGMRAAEESKAVIEELVGNADMVFITAGMGGGTGTGAAPVVARIAKEKGVLTVGVVTTPFGFEGKTRMANANDGIENLIKVVDTLLIIPNNKLKTILPDDVSWDDSFSYADETLRQAIQGTADLIANTCLINLDFADVCTVMRDAGLAHMGVGMGQGENRVLKAIQQAVNSPLLDTTIDNATGVIINIRGGPDLKLKEVESSVDLVRQVVAKDATIIFGGGTEAAMEGKILATVIATGFDIPTSNPSFKYVASAKGMPAPVQPKKQVTVDPVLPPFGLHNAPPARQPKPEQDYTVPEPQSDIPSTRMDAEIDSLPAWLRNRMKK